MAKLTDETNLKVDRVHTHAVGYALILLTCFTIGYLLVCYTMAKFEHRLMQLEVAQNQENEKMEYVSDDAFFQPRPAGDFFDLLGA